MFQLYAEVALRLPLSQTFSYNVPPELEGVVQIGMRVKITFRGRPEEGVICELHRNEPAFETLPLEASIDPEPLLTPQQLQLASWMSDYYLCGIGEAIFKMFPGARRWPKLKKRSVDQEATPGTLKLNSEQSATIAAITATLPTNDSTRANHKEQRSQGPDVHLVHGITGSGKTEIYIELIRHCLSQNRGALLLVPEISLTVQLIERLKRVFQNHLALMHSGLKISERFNSYVALLRGEKSIAVGTRSAVFAPVKNPALIILDEEHDSSYKENSAPRYHARQIAYRRAQEEGMALVLGSATPALESFYSARERNSSLFHYHHLTRRATGASLPQVEMVTINSPDVPISGTLINEIDQNRRRNQQSILLLNRRGYQPFLYCKKCKEALLCPNCSVTLNLHRNGSLQCHYCNYIRRDGGRCDRCGSIPSKMGSGTQKLEEYLLNLLPDLRLERLDSDSAKPEVTADVLSRFIAGELDLLVGTQMIAKGLDAPGVTLVGVLQADLALNFPDFRASERVFALLTQVAGRAGRGDFPGRVFFEVFNPDEPILQMAQRQDYFSFYNHEIENRRVADYPPFVRIIRLLFRSQEEEQAEKLSERLGERVGREITRRALNIKLLGPAPAPILKLNNQFRYHLLLKTLQVEPVRQLLVELLPELKKEMDARTHLEIDFDPVDLI